MLVTAVQADAANTEADVRRADVAGHLNKLEVSALNTLE
jgi:hypothetical protein